MSTITSAQTGLWSVGSTWVGGVVPSALGADKVIIAAGHTVTLDGDIVAGDDTAAVGTVEAYSAAAIMVYGTIKAPRNANSSLTCWGDMVIKNNGQIDFGKIGDVIPEPYTFTLYVNRSATPAHGKYGVICETGGIVHFHGAARKRNTTLASTVTAGATSISVVDATGWKAGEQLFIAPTERSVATATRADIVTIAAGYTSGATTVPLTSAILYPHDVATAGGKGVAVSNFNSNVNIRNYSDSARGYGHLRYGSVSSSGEHTMSYVSLWNLSNTTNTDSFRQGWGYLSYNLTYNTPADIANEMVGNAYLLNAASNGVAFYRFTDQIKVTFRDTLAISYGSAFQTSTYIGNGTTCVLDGFVSANLGTGGNALTCSYSQGPQGVEIKNFYLYTSNGKDVMGSVAAGVTFQNGVIAGRGGLENAATMNLDFNSVDLSGLYRTSASTDYITGAYQPNALFKMTFTDCYFRADHYIGDYNLAGYNISHANSGAVKRIVNRNGDVTAQEKWTNQGVIYRDNAQLLRSRSSIRFEPKVANRAITESFSVSATAGVLVKLGFGLRYDTAYTNATPPSVTVSGLGITPVTFTAGASANTDYEQIVTVTPVTTGVLTVAITGQSTATTGKFWFSGFPVSPWIDWAQHYGYTYNPTSPTLTVDSNVVATYATALAYAGIAWSAGTLTISTDHTGQELYDWHAAYCAANRLAPFITGTPSNLTVAGNLTLNNASLTGSGLVTCSTFNKIGTGETYWTVTHSAGVQTTISVTGYTVGARLQLYSVTNAAEIYNGIPASGTLTITRNWSSNETIRLRMARVVGIDADALIQTTGLFTSSGASFLLSPVPDTVYEANAIDGSTVTEFTADYPNVQIDINDADGVTSPQRCYAWYMNNQMSAASIAAYHGAITAEDTSNYRINTAIANMRAQNVGTNAVVVSGARVYRDDGASIFAPGNGPIQLEPGKAYLAQEPKIDELHGRMGLNAAAPLVTSQSQVSFGSTVMTISESAGTVTVQRQ